MISVAPEDRDALRFLWVDDTSVAFPQIVEFRFAQVVFGVSSSPFLLNGTLKYHVETFKTVDPNFVDKVSRSIYVDDFVSGADEEDELYDLYQKCKVWLKKGGLYKRKFTCSCPALQQKIDHQEGLQLKVVQERLQTTEDDQTYTGSTLGDKQCQQETQKVLGVQWNSMDDHSVFDVRHFGQLAREMEPTRRNIVGIVASFYDPLGIISPVTVQLKIFPQELCGAKLSWDEQITAWIIDRELEILVAGLQRTEPLRVPRCYFLGVDKSAALCTLEGFCDASSLAYGAVVYMRIETQLTLLYDLLLRRHKLHPCTIEQFLDLSC